MEEFSFFSERANIQFEVIGTSSTKDKLVENDHLTRSRPGGGEALRMMNTEKSTSDFQFCTATLTFYLLFCMNITSVCK